MRKEKATLKIKKKEGEDKTAQDTEDKEDHSNLQLAWEMLELVKVVYIKPLETKKETELGLIEPYTEPVLIHLNDLLVVSHLDNAGFTTNFSFEENPYFTRKRPPEATGCVLSMNNGMSENDNVFLRRCEKISLVKINVLKVYHHNGWSKRELGARLSTTMLFILIYDEGRGISDEQWNSLITRVQVATTDK